MVNVATGLNDFERKLDDLDVGKLKAVPIEVKKLNDAVHKKVPKNTRFNKLNTKVNNSENKISDATTLIPINQNY